jgi:hypothetical protein
MSSTTREIPKSQRAPASLCSACALSLFEDIGYSSSSAYGWKGNTIHESEMALFSECTRSCARKVLDTADIVREAMFHHPRDFPSGSLPSIAFE